MNPKTILTVAAGVVNFIAGVVFGGFLGNIFSLCCFPLIAIIYGGLYAYFDKDKENGLIKRLLGGSLITGGALYIGLIIGSIIMIFFVAPSMSMYKTYTTGDTGWAFYAGGIGGGLVCGLVYTILYTLLSTGAGYLVKVITAKKDTKL